MSDREIRTAEREGKKVKPLSTDVELSAFTVFAGEVWTAQDKLAGASAGTVKVGTNYEHAFQWGLGVSVTQGLKWFKK
jgi:hypothetical protein